MKKGDFIKVIGNTNGNNYTIGSIYKIYRIVGHNIIIAEKNGWIGNHLKISDLELIPKTKKYFNNEIKRIEKELDLLLVQLRFLNETDNKIVDKGEFMAWYILKTLESNDNNKYKKISRIINTLSNTIDIKNIINH